MAKNQTFDLKKVLLTVLLTIILLAFIVVIGIASLIILANVTDKKPEFFPLDEPEAEYSVTKECPQGQGWVDLPANGDGYCIVYKGNRVMRASHDQNSHFFRITVGKTDIDLEQYLNKKVKNIRGKYVSSSQQCIQDKCIDIAGPWVVLNVDSLELAE